MCPEGLGYSEVVCHPCSLYSEVFLSQEKSWHLTLGLRVPLASRQAHVQHECCEWSLTASHMLPPVCFTGETLTCLNLAVNNLVSMLGKKKKKRQAVDNLYITWNQIFHLSITLLLWEREVMVPEPLQELSRWEHCEGWLSLRDRWEDFQSLPGFGLGQYSCIWVRRSTRSCMQYGLDPQGLVSRWICVSWPLTWERTRLMLAQCVALQKQAGSGLRGLFFSCPFAITRAQGLSCCPSFLSSHVGAAFPLRNTTASLLPCPATASHG